MKIYKVQLTNKANIEHPPPVYFNEERTVHALIGFLNEAGKIAGIEYDYECEEVEVLSHKEMYNLLLKIFCPQHSN